MNSQTDSTPDPADEDVGNIISLEHVNVQVPDQATATLFYIMGLGFTRDPYMTVGVDNMWINLGEQQFHLPTRPPQVIPGYIGLVAPSLETLEERLKAVEPRLAGTQFAWKHEERWLLVTCPWGNQFRCHAPGDEPYLGDMQLGMSYVEFNTAPGTAEGIARFYSDVMLAPARAEQLHGNLTALVSIGGGNQYLLFTETDEEIPPYDGHHIAIYVANFSRPYGWMREHEVISEDVANHQFRFQDLVDPASGDHVFELEHEVRSLRHPMFRRPLVNRDPGQTQRNYVRGRDALVAV